MTFGKSKDSAKKSHEVQKQSKKSRDSQGRVCETGFIFVLFVYMYKV